MKIKVLFAVLLFSLLFLGLRRAARGAGERWAAEIAEWDPRARLLVDDTDLIGIGSGAGDAERARAALAFLRRLEADPAGLLGRWRGERLVVVIFSSLERLRAHAGERMHADPRLVLGWEDSLRGAIYLPPGAPEAVLRHEVVHFLNACNESRFSPWVEEGLAQYFEDPPPPLPPAIDLERLLSMEDYRIFQSEEPLRNYAESRALVGFLMERRPRETLRAYLEHERGSASGRREAFRALYRDDEPGFARELADWLAGK